MRTIIECDGCGEHAELCALGLCARCYHNRLQRECRRRMEAGEPCRHCRRAKVSRPRGLCWACYYTPGVRELYPVTSKFGRWGVGARPGACERLLPAGPTDALPGTPEKVTVLEERALRGVALWHPDDARASVPCQEVA
jgi:hypothetical protein